MSELHFVLEGLTEEAFVRRVLVPHLGDHGVHATCSVVATKRADDGRKRRGGGDWNKWFTDIRLRLRDKRESVRVTTLFDLYGLPANFPELKEHATLADTRVRCERLERAMATAVGDARLIPYVQRHEFEALVLAGLPALALLLGSDDKQGLARLEADIGVLAPEDVDEGPNTAPSKRLARFIPSYEKSKDKVFFGEQVTVRTGLETLRAKCPRFGAWVGKLEALGKEKS